jgi:hypothetical protein
MYAANNVYEALTEKDLRNQVVVVTGAGSGIGLLLSSRLAKAGARVALWDINAKAVEAAGMSVSSKSVFAPAIARVEFDATPRCGPTHCQGPGSEMKSSCPRIPAQLSTSSHTVVWRKRTPLM